jgi:hypothetical protein
MKLLTSVLFDVGGADIRVVYIGEYKLAVWGRRIHAPFIGLLLAMVVEATGVRWWHLQGLTIAFIPFDVEPFTDMS